MIQNTFKINYNTRHDLSSPQQTEETQKSPLDVITDNRELRTPDIIRNACKLFSVLSKEDALRLFIRAKDGLYSNKNSPSLNNLTRKQYYTRLRNLVDVGLIKKDGDSYTHTTFGSLIYQNYLAIMLHGVKNFKHIQMIDALKETQTLSNDDVTNLMNVVLK
ncbi:MAG: hypothetical protein HMLIMOIP_000300 [Candidatus Nitrosomirales archaeon]|jgi:hypothetical protein